MQSTDDFYRKLVKPIRDDFISRIISSIDSSTFSPYDRELNWAERTTPIKILRERFTEWSKDSLLNLESFPHMYIMNGNTDSLNSLFNRTNNIAWRKGEYSYYPYWHTATKRSYQELEVPTSVPDLLVTWPGYSKGNRDELDFALSCNAERLHLDCAYLGLTKPEQIDTSVFETASISFSKTLSIPYNRISLLFSKKEIPEYSLLNRLGYVNLSGVNLVNKLIEQIPLSYWWDNYGHRLDGVCSKHQLTSTDCILFAYDKEKRIGLAPYWNME